MTAAIIRSSAVSSRHPAVAFLLWALKAAVLWLTILLSFVLAAKLIPVPLPSPPRHDGPLTLEQAFLLVNAAIAAVLAMLATHARVRGVRLAMLLFITLYTVQSGMALIELLYFRYTIPVPVDQILLMNGQAAVVAAVVGVVGALLFHPDAGGSFAVPSRMTGRIAAVTVVYVVLYYAAAYFVAWQVEAASTYYGSGVTPTIDIVALQLGRGLLWALIALYIVCRLKGSLASRAALMAVLFPVLTAGQLLYPNPYVPWAVRSVHMMEVAPPEAVYGMIATLVLLAGAARRPLSETSAWRLITGRA